MEKLNSKQNFFASIAKLPLTEKVATIKEVFTTQAQQEEALSIIPIVISRAKDAELGLKIKLLRENLPMDAARETVQGLLNEERQRRLKSEIEKLPDTLSFQQYLQQNNFGKKDLVNTKKFFKMAASFLTFKRDMNEKIGDKDCEAIQAMLNVNFYGTYRDQMNRIVHMCFRFQGQKIKRIAFAFFDDVLTRYQVIEIGILFNLLEGDYLSLEMYKILSKHIQLITNANMLDKVIAELERIQKADRRATLKEKRRMAELVDKYRNTLREQRNEEFKNHLFLAEEMVGE